MLRRALLGAMKKLKLADRSIEIALVPTAVMKKNVLSFAYPATFPQTAKIKTIGDLYLNPDYIRAHGDYQRASVIDREPPHIQKREQLQRIGAGA